jgi:tetratricopeptide (TPR) repeat protein
MSEPRDSDNVPASPHQLLLEQAEEAYKVEAWKQAERAYNQLLDLDPDNATAWVGLALLALRQRYWKLARIRVKQALSTDLAFIGHLTDLPIIAQHPDKNEKTMLYLQKLLLVEPTSIWILGDIGRLYTTMHQQDLAEDTYLTALSHQPNRFFTGFPLARFYLLEKRYQEALDILETLFGDIPEKYGESFYSAIADAYWGTKQTEYALGYYLELCKLHPNNWRYPWWVGNIYNTRGCWEFSFIHWLKVIELKPDREDAWPGIVWAYLEGGLYDLGLQFANEGIERFPNNERLLVRKCQLLYKLEEYEESYLLSVELTERFPEIYDSYFFKGETLSKLDRWDEAKEAFEMIYDNLTENRFIYCHETLSQIAKLYQANGEEAAAERFLKKAEEFPVKK